MDLVTEGKYTIIGFGGGIRGTKTWGTLSVIIVLCRIFPGSRWAVVRKDLERLRQTTVPSFNKLRPLAGNFIAPVNPQTWEAHCSNGSAILFRGENIDKDPNLERFHGYEVNGFDLEEADELQEKTLFKSIERAGAWVVPRGEQPPPFIFCTFNPNANWPMRVFYEPWKNGTLAAPYAFIPTTIADNPHAPESYRQSLKLLPPEEYKRFVEGDWDTLTGRFYDSLNKGVHLIPPDQLPASLPSWWEYWGAFDWGYSHWAVFGAFARDPDGNTFLLDSLWLRKQQDDDLARTIVATMPPECLKEVYAGADCWSKFEARGGSGVTTAEVFDAHGIELVPADTDLVNGGRAVRRALAVRTDADGTRHPGVYIVDTDSWHQVGDYRMRNNLRVFEQLASTMPDENNINKPAKMDADAQGRGGDDGSDMFRYGLATQVETPADMTEELELRAARSKLDSLSRQEAEELAKLEKQLTKGRRRTA